LIQVSEERVALLGLALTLVAGLAHRAAHRPTRHCYQVAPDGIQALLAVEIQPKTAGRPSIDQEIRDLIRRMARENPSWGTPHILSELRLLGYEVAQAIVAKYMPKNRKPPSQNWRTFLANHVPDIAAIDFFTVPTLTLGVLYGFVILRHDQRQVIHFNVTQHSTAQWTAQQIVESFPLDEAPRSVARSGSNLWRALLPSREK
jgi:putative transposase